jgi:hypothetical protein
MKSLKFVVMNTRPLNTLKIIKNIQVKYYLPEKYVLIKAAHYPIFTGLNLSTNT